jgi:dephospho-CoA kinase
VKATTASRSETGIGVGSFEFNIMGLGITSKTFVAEVEALVKAKKMSYMDAVLYVCEKNDIEPERIVRFIDKGMKEKIQVNAEELNYLPKTSRIDGL